jgi:aminoglycoside 6'-N-acetyltransferase I
MLATVGDTRGRTNLYGVNVIEDAPRLLTHFACHANHPAGFFLNIGYRLVGLLPDAYGPGKHDLTLARRITKD